VKDFETVSFRTNFATVNRINRMPDLGGLVVPPAVAVVAPVSASFGSWELGHLGHQKQITHLDIT